MSLGGGSFVSARNVHDRVSEQQEAVRVANSTTDKEGLLARGIDLMKVWCDRNDVAAPAIKEEGGRPTFCVCAYYRDDVIYIWTRSCAGIGRAGRQWSYPGYSVDRTPYGVIAHELGHHVDRAHGAGGGKFGRAWRKETGELPLTGYCPNDNEWFAEMFRLFVTNSDLLRALRPRTFALMSARWRPVITLPWRVVLSGAERQRAVIEKRVGDGGAR
jgi:hypothetical protein